MEAVFTLLKYVVIGFFGLIGLLFFVAIVFGKRVRKEWELEAEFRNEKGREFGEFDIESSRIEKEEPDFSVKAKFKMRHADLAVGDQLEIRLDDALVLEGKVTEPGRVLIRRRNMEGVVARQGQICRVLRNGTERWSAELLPDGLT